MLKNFKPRLYQETIFGTCVQKNTLVVLPTGMGKTAIAIMLAVQRLKQYPNSKIVILAPTKPLVEQHLKSFMKYIDLDENNFKLFTGAISPEKRAELWDKTQIIFCTPQTIDNDIISRRVDLKKISLIVFDEAHRATGDYAYTFIAKQYNKLSPISKILALTASPGSDKEKINEIIQNLYIDDIEVRTETDPDVKPYIQQVDMNWLQVELPEKLKQVQKFLLQCYNSKLLGIKEAGFLNSSQVQNLSKRELLGIMNSLHREVTSGNREFTVLKALSLVAEAMKVQHAIELLESQGVGALEKYFEKLIQDARTSKTKAVKNLVVDLNFRSAYVLTKNMSDDGIEHPKLTRLKEILKAELNLGIDKSEQITIDGKKLDSKNKKIIIFTQYRDSGKRIEEILNAIDGIKSKLFVGQAKKGNTGLTQKKQIELLNDFKNEKFNVIIMTSVGEEGLDIPQVDLVIFYEPIPSGIRTVQRRGRTGRLERGKIIILYTKGTRDETYMWVAHRKEKNMYKIMDEIKKKGFIKGDKDIQNLSNTIEKQRYLTDDKIVDEKHITILVDAREKGSQVIKELVDMGIHLQLKRIDIGDYILSERVAVEFKRVPDFVDSIIDGRLLQQIKGLKENYQRPLIIVEGIEDIYSIRRIHPNAILGMLATIAISYSIPILYTKTFKETAGLLHIIAKREQESSSSPIQLHTLKPMELKDIQEYIVSSFPGIGSTLNKPLLDKFGSIKNIVNASEEELKQVEKIGDKKAKEIKKVIDSKYDN